MRGCLKSVLAFGLVAMLSGPVLAQGQGRGGPGGGMGGGFGGGTLITNPSVEKELKLAAEERDLVPLVDALGAMAEIAGAVAFNVGAVAPGFTRDVPERDRLQKAIDDALKTVADRVEELGAALRSGREDPETDGEDDAGPVGE